MKEGILSSVAKRFGRSGAAHAPLRSEADIKQWMVNRLATQLKIPAASVDTARPFDSYGLDSRTAVAVSGELEKVVERRLSPALLIEHSTIDGVASELARELSHEDADD